MADPATAAVESSTIWVTAASSLALGEPCSRSEVQPASVSPPGGCGALQCSGGGDAAGRVHRRAPAACRPPPPPSHATASAPRLAVFGAVGATVVGASIASRALDEVRRAREWGAAELTRMQSCAQETAASNAHAAARAPALSPCPYNAHARMLMIRNLHTHAQLDEVDPALMEDEARGGASGGRRRRMTLDEAEAMQQQQAAAAAEQQSAAAAQQPGKKE